MLLIYVIVVISCLWGARKRPIPSAESALSIQQTEMVKGVFVLLVFASHISQYMQLDLSSGFFTQSYLFIQRNLGQLVVVPFLFYSGYGIRYSIEKKGEAYIKSLPVRRFLKTYLRAALIATLYLIMELLLGTRYSLRQILLGYLFWESFGNSNWYIFAILLLYWFTWVSFSFVKKTTIALAGCCALVCVYSFVMSRFAPHRFYDTVFAYCFGLLFPNLCRLIRCRVEQRFFIWAGLLLMCLAAVLMLTRGFPDVPHSAQENLRGILFILLMFLVLVRVEIGNELLRWAGAHVFEFYMLQRLPMILLHHFGLSRTNAILFVCASFIATGLLVAVFSKILQWFDRPLFPKGGPSAESQYLR